MAIYLTKPTGEMRKMQNSDFLPAFYFLPAEVLQASEELFNIPRNPNEALKDKNMVALIESDLMRLMLSDGFAYLAWPHMKIRGTMESYSGYDPFWLFAHRPEYWVQELIDRKIIPQLGEFLQIPPDMGYGYNSWELVQEVMSDIVPAVMEKYNMREIIKIVNQARCVEDFDGRYSQVKIDFHRKWYHTRAKMKTVSLEGLYELEENPIVDIADERIDVVESVCADVSVEEFMKLLKPKDMQILQMRLEGATLKEVADKLGYKTHSAVQKRIKNLCDMCDDFFKVN